MAQVIAGILEGLEPFCSNSVRPCAWPLAANLPLYQRPQIVAAKSDVANYGAFGFQDTDWTRVGFTR
ncbi:hypothetical protein ABZ461_33560 [Actinacidiphila glaucinigra]|uniref:hypothetical protein n=1 Tax=Actinacidiphila glaucinigra TaxID=235986 RepID=UPI0033D1D2EC